MTLQLSKDISSLFDAYEVTEPKYKELSEKERYYQTKQKWQALKGISYPKAFHENDDTAQPTVSEHHIQGSSR